MEGRGVSRSMSKRYDMLQRLLLVGETGVGKTCLLCRYANNEFMDTHITTIGVDFKLRRMEVDNKVIKAQIWDTAGQERFESITKQFYRRAQGILLVYDITSRQSFEAVPKWLSYIHQFANEDVQIMLLGNKSDQELRRMVTTREATRFAEENNLMFFETSAKSSGNLEQALYTLCKSVLEVEVNKTLKLSDIKIGDQALEGGLTTPTDSNANKFKPSLDHGISYQHRNGLNSSGYDNGVSDRDTVNLLQDDKQQTSQTCCSVM
ncbi:ras-related protein Rab-13-like [Ylistrum balloti]|uniref:ras-related protein Rab-13-like n=1 Tax=Ylistrum balloti TaxID=509963 RepID=UPI002905A56B|nr:ras-related protein Rab-13-like [Ylistrum balloti]